MKRAFDQIEMKLRTRKIIRSVMLEVWRAWVIGRKRDPELYAPNNFFKSKYGNRRILALAYPRVRKDLLLLGRDVARVSY
jgi:hypothetical protein